MRLPDLLGLPVAALWQQKARTAMTTLGVLFGSFVLAASLSISEGIQATFEREMNRSEHLRRIDIRSKWEPTEPPQPLDSVAVAGDMSEDRRTRLRQAIRAKQSQSATQKQTLSISPETMQRVEAIDHVVDVLPEIHLSGDAITNGVAERCSVLAVRTGDESVGKRLVVGRDFQSADEPAMLVSEHLAYRWGVVNEADEKRLLGKKARLEVRAGPYRRSGFGVWMAKPNRAEPLTREENAAIDTIRQELPKSLDKLGLTAAQVALLTQSLGPSKEARPSLIAEEFEIVGVLRAPTSEEQQSADLHAMADVMLPPKTAMAFLARTPDFAEMGIERATVRVDHFDSSKEVAQRLNELGWQARAPLEWVERQRLQWTLVFAGMTCVAAVALLVASLGIANTMLMSVLERTREIGIMKALGATHGQLMSVFLIEGALIGVVGASLGLALAASYPGDAWVRSMVNTNEIAQLKEPIFIFPAWLIAVVLVFTAAVTTLGALYPARRAAKVDPVTALRHE